MPGWWGAMRTTVDTRGAGCRIPVAKTGGRPGRVWVRRRWRTAIRSCWRSFAVAPGQKDALSEEERKTLAQQLAQQTGSGQFDKLLDSVRTRTKVVTYSDRL